LAGFDSRDYWVYDPASGLFVQNALKRELSENCFAAAHGDCWSAYLIDFDPKKHEVSTRHFGVGNTGCGSGADRYRVENNRLILVHKEEITRSGPYLPRDCEVTEFDLIGGAMRFTGVRRGGAASPSNDAPPSQSPDGLPLNSLVPVSPMSGDFLYESPLDGRQQGLFSNTGERHQVGGGQFVVPDAVAITGIRWFGYYTCQLSFLGTTPFFNIRFLPDSDGLPSSAPIYSRQVVAHVRSAMVSVVRDPAFAGHYEVYEYTVDSLPPLPIPAGRRMWISISEVPSSCEWVWNRSSSVDTGAGAWGVSEGSRFSKWTQLDDNHSLAFAIYGRKN